MDKPFLLLVAVCTAAVLGGFAAYLLEQVRAANLRADRTSLRADAQGRCLGMIARELEAPGLSLLGLAARLPPDAAAKVEAEARRLLALSEEVADRLLSHPGRRGLTENRLPLGPLLREVIETVSHRMGEGARHWRVTPEAEAMVLLADRRALRRALSQSLARAARETRTGDRIVLRVVRAAETVALVIEDEGAGLPRDDLSGQHDRGQHDPSSRNWGLRVPIPEEPGRGDGACGEAGPAEGTRGLSLGLAAARELIRAHGGELTLEAVPGIGTRTWLTLPRARVVEEPAPA